MRFARVWITICFTLGTPRAMAQGPELIDRFCHQLSEHGMWVAFDTSSWDQLLVHLQNPASEADLSAIPQSELDQCRDRYGADFELAEFILQGRAVLEQSARAAIARSTSQISAPSKLRVSLPEWGDLEIASDQAIEKSSPSEGLSARRAEYDRMWQAFAAQLKRRVGTAVSVQVVEK